MNDKLYEYAMANIDPVRTRHTLGVIKAACELNTTHHTGLIAEKLETAALLHDITKHFTNTQHIELCKKYNMLDILNLNIPKTFHQVTGFIIAKYELNINDYDILNAIRYHTTGREDMSMYEKLIFIADFIEENRTYDGVEDIRKSCELGLENVLITGLAFTIEDLASKKNEIHIDTFTAYNYYIKKQNNSSDFVGK